MCGICGIARPDGPPVDREAIAQMAEAMRHRGPDDQGEWISIDGRAGFGHRRLAVIDLSRAGHQPMQDASGRLSITFNGEIYNYRELRSELSRRGHRFATSTDTEVILAGYREWGADVPKRLNGMFAFAIHDEEERRLFLARDRAGEKPLYYSHQNGVFAFASELKALMRMPGFERRIDRAALNEYLAFGYVPGASCILAGVRKLPQGCSLVLDLARGTLAVDRYWRLPEPYSAGPYDEEALVEELEQLLLDSVRMRMIADVPVGILLSGGVDSSLITAMAARLTSKLRTFTITFPHHGTFNEAPFARLVADHFGTDHLELAAEPATVELLPQLAAQFDEPRADSSIVPMHLVSRLVRRDATVALGGDGGDELFGGYFQYEWVRRQQLVRGLIPPPLRRVTSLAARMLPRAFRGRDYLLRAADDVDQSIAGANLYFDLAARRRLLGIADDAPLRAKSRIPTGRTAVQRAMAADFQTYLADDILVKVDRASMLASVEMRAPMLDPRLIEFAFGRVPDQLRAWRGERKVLLRKLARRVLPPQLDTQRKQGFSIPLHEWFKGDWGRFMREVIGASELFDRREVATLFREEELLGIHSHRLFALTMLELWRQTYDVAI
ncbi:MAG TPA: asparagine synthase (glutamine-hydrolyzing) [Thermoanaerobaculia bacterium]|nr:asparagine synthase (glutamine-hydrolyzing) [Thermoanaerobaculia bacterium]